MALDGCPSVGQSGGADRSEMAEGDNRSPCAFASKTRPATLCFALEAFEAGTGDTPPRRSGGSAGAAGRAAPPPGGCRTAAGRRPRPAAAPGPGPGAGTRAGAGGGPPPPGGGGGRAGAAGRPASRGEAPSPGMAPGIRDAGMGRRHNGLPSFIRMQQAPAPSPHRQTTLATRVMGW